MCNKLFHIIRMTKALTDIDGPSWREKLPPIPSVPLSVKEGLAQAANSAPTSPQNGLNDNKPKGKDMNQL